ncbi:MAG: UPF0182 family protein [Nitrospinaceae bacterium]|jgi:hypothetical protein|nr:UPF0182 family protein [Nitrospinaceae bacterium]HAK38353.1 membrane protein [Nitrospina sp.]
MNTQRKWLFILLGIVTVGSMFAEKIIGFYFNWIWFAHHEFDSVFWTIVFSQWGFGLVAGVLFFTFTCFPLKRMYDHSSHIPVLLSDSVRRELPLLDLIASNLRKLMFFGPLVLAVMTGLIIGQKWEIVQLYAKAVPFGSADPIFGNDYSFYLFTLPFLNLGKSILWEAFVVLGIGTGIIFFLKQFIYLGPNGIVMQVEARRPLSSLVFYFLILMAMEFHLQRYDLLLEGNGVVTGIGFADYYGQLPILNTMSWLSLAGAGLSFFIATGRGVKKVVLALTGIGVIYFAGSFYPKILQNFVVNPNELIKETPFIEHTIAGSLKAYGLDTTESKRLTGAESLNAESIQANSLTIENIRLWDQEPLLDTLGQIQEIRTYYQFNSVDNDRYTIDGKYRQTLLSPRELQSENLPNRTWINEHLTFTHGYGVSLSPVNQITPQGMPVLFIKDIPPQSNVDLKVEQPEIYFGELSNDHVFVNTGTKEFDYPEGEKNVYKNYEGSGGFPVDSFIRKLLLAARFKTLKILFSQDIKSESRVLMYRNITERVLQVVPFLRLDSDPYLVVTEGKMKWIYDAYTVSDQFPYSQTIPRFGNYVRNSVKIVIDAYEGSMQFYITDPNDPVILTWKNIFPKLFKDLSEMPEDLRSHIRYPSDLFTIQAFIYATYHMKTPQVFYNKEDQWEIPEIDNKMMEPYYTIMKLPGNTKEEYILMLPFTPRGKSNLSAWMVAQSDGENYGQLVAYTFPKQKLIYGPNQIVARINQDAEVSRQISLWDQRGSKVIQGTMLVIPIEESLIYVRPLYLKADAGKIPELKRVIVGYEDRIAMESTLEKALAEIFGESALESLPSSMTAEKDAVQLVDASPKPSGNIILKQSDYQTIKNLFGRAMKRQEEMNKKLSDHNEDMEALGRALDSATVVKKSTEE